MSFVLQVLYSISAQEAEAVTTDSAGDGAMIIGSCVLGSGNFLGNCVGECKAKGFSLGLCVGNNGGVCRCSS